MSGLKQCIIDAETKFQRGLHSIEFSIIKAAYLRGFEAARNQAALIAERHVDKARTSASEIRASFIEEAIKSMQPAPPCPHTRDRAAPRRITASGTTVNAPMPGVLNG